MEHREAEQGPRGYLCLRTDRCSMQYDVAIVNNCTGQLEYVPAVLEQMR
jgi:hypothetical protein